MLLLLLQQLLLVWVHVVALLWFFLFLVLISLKSGVRVATLVPRGVRLMMEKGIRGGNEGIGKVSHVQKI